MVRIQPFKAVRPTSSLAEKVASLPYDVLNSQEARELARTNPYSYLHIDKAEIDLPPTTDPYSAAVYLKAASNYSAFKEQGWLIQENEPALYLYRLTMAGRSQTGLVTCTSIEDYLAGSIKKHEFTRYEKEIDRIEHSQACAANTSPIFLTYRGDSQIQQLIADWQTSHTALYDFASFHEVRHEVWLVDDPKTIQTFQSLFATNVPALYIADGHHRTESAVKIGQRYAQAHPDAPADAEFRSFLAVLFPKEELAIWDYNRVFEAPLPADFFQQLATTFTVTPLSSEEGRNGTIEQKNFHLYVNQTWYRLSLHQDLIPGETLAKLDVSLLQKYFFERYFAVEDVRQEKRIDFVGGIRGRQELERLVDEDRFTLAVALAPTKMDELLTVADEGGIMPPKSTWFEPKLLSGLFVHELANKG